MLKSHIRRDVAAVHEAGHAVAAILRPGSEVLSVDINSGDELVGTGVACVRSSIWDDGFIGYAGPWAEARLEWNDTSLLNTVNGLTFVEHIDTVIVEQEFDHAAILEHERLIREYKGKGPVGKAHAVAESYTAWNTELESSWAAVLALAERLVPGEILYHDDVEEIVHRVLPHLAESLV